MKKFIIVCSMALIFIACSKDDSEFELKVSPEEIRLTPTKTAKIEVVHKKPVEFSIDNTNVAIVDEYRIVTARKVGTAVVTVTSGTQSKEVKVNVIAEYYVYPEPDVSFGDSRASIISKYGIPDQNATSSITYLNYSDSFRLAFTFDGNDKLTSYGILVSASSLTRLTYFLQERYWFIVNDNGLYYFVNNHNPQLATTTVILSKYNNDYYMVAYLPYISSKSSAIAHPLTTLNQVFN